MKLRRVEIRNFRKLVGPVVLEGLGDGLTIVAGDNEEGKSTVLAALKAAFFESHGLTGSARDAMSPLGRDGTPEVGVTFELSGRPYVLRKAFKKGGCCLETPAGRLEGDAAERRLQELLSFERPGRGAAKPEHMGLQALFWVDQATTFAGLRPTDAARGRLGAAIAIEVGAATSGEGLRGLIEAVRERCDRFWTPTWRETGELTRSSQRLAELTREHADLLAQRRAHDDKVDRLARLRQQRRLALEADHVGTARARVADLAARLAGLAELERRREVLTEQRKAAEAEIARLEGQRRGRQQQEGALTELKAKCLRLATQRRQLGQIMTEADGAFSRARAREAGMRVQLRSAERRRETARHRLTLAQGRRTHVRLKAALAAAEAAEVARRTRKAALAQDPATPDRVEAVRDCRTRREAASAALQAVATRLELHPDTGADVKVAGARVDPAEPLLLTETTTLHLDGFGRITVVPGAADIGRRRQALAQAEHALTEALAAVGARTAAEAEQLAERRRTLEGSVHEAETRLSVELRAAGARTIEDLRDRLAAAAAEALRLADLLGEGVDAPEPDEASLDPAGLDAAVAKAAAELEGCREAMAAAERQLQDLRTEDAKLASQAGAMDEQITAIEARLAQERAERTDAALEEALREARARQLEVDARHETAERELRLADPETVREKLTVAQRTLEGLEAEARRLDQQIRDLEIELRALGGDRFGERLPEVEALLGQARAEAARLRREANALKLLHDELTAADTSARAALLGPIRERLAPYLQRIFPDAELTLDADELKLTHLSRDGRMEPYESLSIGTREQLAVLVRLALARLLHEKEGEASCLVLDDALVYADEARFETMKTILQRAAADLQILVLTCRPRDYLGLAARYIRLEDCRR